MRINPKDPWRLADPEASCRWRGWGWGVGGWGRGAGRKKTRRLESTSHAVPESLLDGGERPGTKRGRRSERGRTRGLSGPVVTGPMEHPAPGGGTPGPVLLASGGGARGAAGWGEGGGRESCREMAEFVPPSVAGSRTPRPGRARQVVEGARTPPATGRQPAPPEGLPPPDTVQAGADPGSANASRAVGPVTLSVLAGGAPREAEELAGVTRPARGTWTTQHRSPGGRSWARAGR